METSAQKASLDKAHDGPQVIVFDAGLPAGLGDGLSALLSACTPAPRLTLVQTPNDVRGRSEQNDRVLVLFWRARTALRWAMAQGEDIGMALTDWQRDAKVVEDLLRALPDKTVLFLHGAHQADDLLARLDLTPPSEDLPYLHSMAVPHDPLIDCIVENALQGAPNPLATIDGLGLDDSSDSSLAERAAAAYFELCSKVKELKAERDSLNHQVRHGQDVLDRALSGKPQLQTREDQEPSGLAQTIYDAVSLGRSKRRLGALRQATQHKPTTASFGPLTPHRFIIPNLATSPSKIEAHDGAANSTRKSSPASKKD